MRCRNYSLENKQCRLIYDNPFCVSMQDLIPQCGGLSDITKCAWYRTGYSTEVDMKENRIRLRKLREELGLVRE